MEGTRAEWGFFFFFFTSIPELIFIKNKNKDTFITKGCVYVCIIHTKYTIIHNLSAFKQCNTECIKKKINKYTK